MSTINLTNQAITLSTTITGLDVFRGLLDARKVVWDKLEAERKQAWIESGQDPVLTRALAEYQYLKAFFQGAGDYE